MEEFLTEYSYLGIAACVWGTALGFPIPEDIILLLSGWLCAKDYASLWVMLPMVFVCVVGGDMVIYGLGRWASPLVPKIPLLRHIMNERKLAMAEAAMLKHGGKTVFITRLTPLIRAPIYFTAGALKMPAWRFFVADMAGALISVPIVVLLGWGFSEQIEKLKDYAHDVQHLVKWGMAIAVVLIISLYVYFSIRQKRQMEAEARELDPQLHHHLDRPVEIRPMGEDEEEEKK